MTQINEYNVKPATKEEFLKWEVTHDQSKPMPDNIKAFIYAEINKADTSLENFINEAMKQL